MTTLARYHPRGIDIELADLPRDLYTEIASLHGQIDPPPAPPVLTCLGNGKPLYVWRHHSGRYFARHYPYDNPDKHSHVIATMSDEHRRQAEYTLRAAVEAGLQAKLEHSTGNGTRLDVAVTGSHDVGFEVQRSYLSRARAKSRAARSFEAGWPTAWITDQERDPDWAGHVPTARLSMRGGWDALPPRNTARAVIGRFTRERDNSRPSGWSYRREPTTVLLDELAYLMAAGQIIPVAVGSKGKVSLAHSEAREVIDSCTYPGASLWRPATATPRSNETAQRFTRVCAHGESPTPSASPDPVSRTVPLRETCAFCSQELWAPQSQERGVCEHHWLALRLDRDPRAHERNPA